jgi:hypothetical protein
MTEIAFSQGSARLRRSELFIYTGRTIGPEFAADTPSALQRSASTQLTTYSVDRTTTTSSKWKKLGGW